MKRYVWRVRITDMTNQANMLDLDGNTIVNGCFMIEEGFYATREAAMKRKKAFMEMWKKEAGESFDATDNEIEIEKFELEG